jgi:hypothetical protein
LPPSGFAFKEGDGLIARREGRIHGEGEGDSKMSPSRLFLCFVSLAPALLLVFMGALALAPARVSAPAQPAAETRCFAIPQCPLRTVPVCVCGFYANTCRWECTQ